MSDEFIKVNKKELERILEANTEAYNLLDEISSSAEDVHDKIVRAKSQLESVPSEISDLTVEEDKEEVNDKS